MESSCMRLPSENVIWIVRRIESTDDEDCEEDVWTICDSHNNFIGARTQKSSETPSACVLELIIESMNQPLGWKPRRPKYVSFPVPDQRPDVDVSKFGIICTNNPSKQILPENQDRNIPPEPVTSCSSCERSGSKELFMACPNCQTTLYCSEACIKKDLDGLYEGMPGHSFWCSKMAEFSKQTNELASFPFNFARETTNKYFDEQKYRIFQQRLGVFGKGLWRREWSLYLSPFSGFYGELCDKTDNDYVIEQLNTLYTVTAPPPPPVFTLLSWSDYIKWRCLDTDSPAAILMQWPLTLYHAIVNLFPKHYKNKEFLFNKKKLLINLIGVEKELDILPVFHELGNLLPHIELDIVMIGNEIAHCLHGKVVKHQNKHNNSTITFSAFFGYYHNYYGDAPDIAFSFNAGLAAYPSWEATARALYNNKTPTFFTDYFHISCESARQHFLASEVTDISDIAVNPFRSPVRRYIEEHMMPSYSNGFIFSLKLE